MMWRFIARRVGIAIPTLLGIIVLNFFLIQLAPGDPASVLAGEQGAATPEYMAALRAKFALDDPVYVQFLRYMGNTLTLDLGYSYRNDETVASLILERLGATLLLMITAFVVALILGTLLGLASAIGRSTWRDGVISTLALILYATPGFWLGLMLIWVFSINLGWLPTSGFETIGAFKQGWDRVLDVARHLILPATALALFQMALYARLMRTSALEQLNQDFVTTARAKGATEGRILVRHVMRNALLPIVTMAGIQAGNLIGGSLIIETVFGWPGLGTLAFNALQSRDVNLLLGIFMVSAVLVIVTNLLADLVLVRLDPRMEA